MEGQVYMPERSENNGRSRPERDDRMGTEKHTEPALLLRFAERARGHGFMIDVVRLYQADGGPDDDALKGWNGIDDDGLSKLLLCGLPRRDERYADDVARIAEYAGVDGVWLADVARRYDPRVVSCRICAGRAAGARACPACRTLLCATCWPEEASGWAIGTGEYGCPTCGLLELRTAGYGLVYEWPRTLDGTPPLPAGARDWLRYRDDPTSCAAAGGNRCVADAVAAHRRTIMEGDGFPRGGFVIDWLADVPDIAQDVV